MRKNTMIFVFWVLWSSIAVALYFLMFRHHSLTTQLSFGLFTGLWVILGDDILRQLIKDFFDNPPQGWYTCVAKETQMYGLPEDMFVCDCCQEKFFVDDAHDYGDMYVCKECLESLTADDEELYEDV